MASPERVAFALGTSSGESSAKAATGGKAAVGAKNHAAACNMVTSGKAKAAFVKNWWWEEHRQDYPDLAAFDVPGVSEVKNPDFVLSVSGNVSKAVATRLATTAKNVSGIFGAKAMVDFDPVKLDFSVELMRKGKIDPARYRWQ